MRKLEAFVGTVAGIAGLATFGLAMFVLGALIFNRSGDDPADALANASAPVATQSSDASAPVQTAAVAAQPETPVAASDQPAPVMATITIADGEKVFKKCKACHTVDEGGKTLTGPNLWGIVGKDVATTAGFGYSDAMAELGGAWDAARLDTYLTKPKDLVPGTKMSFAGLRKEADRHAVILFLAQNAATPLDAAALGFAPGAADAGSAAAVTEAAVEIEDVPYPEGVTYHNPPGRSEEEQAAIADRVAVLEELAPTLDYERARFHPLHFPPAIETASNEECLVCHQEIMEHKPREASPAGVPAIETIAWYQTLDTYFGDQATFHSRHLESDYAKAVMNLQCNFCHKGNDPREESPDMMRGRSDFTAPTPPEFTLRKMVNPSTTCLRCHGAMPNPEEIMGLGGAWPEVRADMEYPEAPNGCLSCHAELYRTDRHNVSYLNAANIEEIARWGSSDSCYGCHGGRAWYRISYPYPRHAWPGMEDMVGDEVPEWALDRPTASDPAYALPAAE